MNYENLTKYAAAVLALLVLFALASITTAAPGEIPCSDSTPNLVHPDGALLLNAENSMVVVDGVPGRFSVMFYGPSYFQTPLPMGHGQLCVNPVFALTEDAKFLNGLGRARYNQPPLYTWAQVWYRDLDGAANLTNMTQVLPTEP